MEEDNPLLIAYLDGTLEEEDRIAFEAEVEKKPELKAALELERDVRKAIQLDYKIETLNKVKDIYHAVIQEETSERKPNNIWNFYTISLAAVLLLLILFSWIFIDVAPTYTNEGLLESYAAVTVIPDSHNLMGQTQRDIFQEGLEAVNRDNWELAREQFLQIADSSKLYDQAQFYIGLSYFEEDEYQKALAYFSTNESISHEVLEQNRWFSALSHLGANEIEEVKLILKQIVDDDQQYFMKESAAKLLNELNHPVRKLPGI